MNPRRYWHRVFETDLDRAFYIAWGRDPFDMLDDMVAQGYSYPYAFATIERIIDKLWKRYLEDLQEEKTAMKTAFELECPWT